MKKKKRRKMFFGGSRYGFAIINKGDYAGIMVDQDKIVKMLFDYFELSEAEKFLFQESSQHQKNIDWYNEIKMANK